MAINMIKLALILIIITGYPAFLQSDCIKHTIKNSFSAQIAAMWYVSNVSKFKVDVKIFVNSLYDLFAYFKSSAGEDFEIYKFKKKMAIYDRNTGRWIPYKRAIYLKGIRLLNLRELFAKVLKLFDNKPDKSIQTRCFKKKHYIIVLDKSQAVDILTFIFDKNELPQESTGKIDIKCSCSAFLQTITIKFQIKDSSTTIKGTVKFDFSIQQQKMDFNIPAGIKKFLGK